jgi:hypothetical protein
MSQFMDTSYASSNRPQRKLPAAVMVCVLLMAISAASRADAASIPMNGLIGYWTGDNTAADSSPVGNNGSFGGGYVPGGPGGGAAFNLATGKVIIPDNPAYDFQSYAGWTVGFWFNTNGIPISSNNGTSNRTFLGQDNGSGFRPKWLIDYGSTVFGPNNSFVLHFNDFNQERIFLLSDPVTIPTGWNQLTVVVDNSASTVGFYFNGTSVGTIGMPAYVLQPTAPLEFGAAEPGLSYSGLMNNVTIYDRSLSSQEVSQLADLSVVQLPSSVWMGMALLIGVGSLRLHQRRRHARRL